jgi:hypothetical protein
MELEEMKQLWQQYDKQLQQTQKTNQQLIHNILKERAQNDLRKILNYEYLSLAVCAAVLLLLAGSARRASDSTFITGCLVASFAFCIAGIAAGFYKVSLLSNTSFSKPVAQTLLRINRFNLFITKERIASTVLIPILIFVLAAVGRKLVWDENMLDHLRFWVPILALSFAIAIAGCLMIYRNLYFKRIAIIKSNLEEIAHFTNG